MKFLIGTIIITLAFIGTVFVLSTTYFKQSAIDNCMKVATIQSESTSGTYKNTYTQPNPDFYKQCMKDKGYK